MLVQDLFFSTQMAEPSSSKWLGGPQVLLQGTLNDTNTNVIVIMNACVSPSPSHCGLPSRRSPSCWPALSSPKNCSTISQLHNPPAPMALSFLIPCRDALVVMHGTEMFMSSTTVMFYIWATPCRPAYTPAP